MLKKSRYYSEDYFLQRDILPIHFLETFNLLLKKLSVKTVLDVGCGTGLLVKYLKKEGFQAIGCDSSEIAAKISGQIKGSATNLPFETASFDLISTISLIEHLKMPEAEKFFKEAERVLKSKGYLFLVTPNLWSLMKVFKKNNWFAYTDPTHIQFYNPLSLRKLLEKHGFKNFCFRFKVDPKTPADWCFASPRLTQSLQFVANFLLLSTPISYFRDSFWVLCQKED